MAIDLYSGTPGSGKSLHAAKDIVEWARKGKPMITNFPVDLSRYPKANHLYVEDDDLTPKFLADFSRAFFAGRELGKKDENTILLVLDECQMMFNSREYQKKDRKIWIKFFTQHRHIGYRVILIAQMDKMLDKQIRGVIEHEFMHRRLSSLGLPGKIMAFFTGGELFTAVKMFYPLKLKVGNTLFRCKKRYYKIYDSYASFGDYEPETKGKKPAAAARPAPEPAQEKNDAKAPEVTSDTVPLPDLTQLPAPEPVDQSYADAPKTAPVRLHRWQRIKLRFRIWKRKHQKQGKYMRSSVRNERGWKIS